MAAETQETTRIKIGFVTVDDGRIALHDGCDQRDGQWPEVPWQGGNVIVSGFGGDGDYPVYVEKVGRFVSRIVIAVDEELAAEDLPI